MSLELNINRKGGHLNTTVSGELALHMAKAHDKALDLGRRRRRAAATRTAKSTPI